MPATAAGEGMTGSPPPGLPTAGTPGTDERHTPHPLHPPEPQQPPSPLSTSCADRRRPQGPAAATRSGSARALTPTPISTCTQPAGEDPKTVSTPLDRPRSFRDDPARSAAVACRAASRLLNTGATAGAGPGSVEVLDETLSSRLPTGGLVWLFHGVRSRWAPLAGSGSRGVCSARRSVALLRRQPRVGRTGGSLVGRVVIGTDPHKRSATIEVRDEREILDPGSGLT